MMLERNFTKVMDNLKLDGANKTVAIAFSGGSDSLTLLLLLHRYLKKSETIAITVNHNLRPESSIEAEKCQETAKGLGINHIILHWQHAPISKNLQEQARLARYELMTEFCLKKNINHLFVAHNKNDIAETFMINLFRGSGVYGLSAIPMLSIYNNIHIVRPLLDFDKSTLQEFLSKNNIQWIEDPSNTKDIFLRTKIRKLLTSKPMKEIVSEPALLIDRIALAAKNMARAREELEKTCESFIKNEVKFHDHGYSIVNKISFSALSEEIALKVLSCCLMTIIYRDKPQPRLKSLQKLYNNILNGKALQTLNGCEILVKNENIYIYREIGRKPFIPKQISDSAWMWDGRFIITALSSHMKICDIVMPSYNDIESQNIKIKENFSKKIWKTLPLIITYDSERLLCFLNSRASENFSVKFLGKTRLVGIKDDININ